jgi:hypothetical protein
MHTLTQRLRFAFARATAIAVGSFALAASALWLMPHAARAATPPGKPTVVLVHGAFAVTVGSANWTEAISVRSPHKTSLRPFDSCSRGR